MSSTTIQENKIQKNANGLRLAFIGRSGHSFELEVDADDFSDNNEKPALVEATSRGRITGVVDGARPARTGSFSVNFYTKNNLKAEAFLDVINGFNGNPSASATPTAWDWSQESTGRIGLPYVQQHCLTMVKTQIGAIEDGGRVGEQLVDPGLDRGDVLDDGVGGRVDRDGLRCPASRQRDRTRGRAECVGASLRIVGV